MEAADYMAARTRATRDLASQYLMFTVAVETFAQGGQVWPYALHEEAAHFLETGGFHVSDSDRRLLRGDVRDISHWSDKQGGDLTRALRWLFTMASDPDAQVIVVDHILETQAVVSATASLEAFALATLKRLCTLRPDSLRGSPQLVPLGMVLSVGDWDSLVASVAELYAQNLRAEGVDRRIRGICSTFDLDVGQIETHLYTLKDVVAVRNALVHNDGRAGKGHKPHSANLKVAFGEFVPIPPGFVPAMFEASLELVQLLYALSFSRQPAR